MNIYIQHKFSLFTFALGSIGFMILYGSIENWEVKFNKWFKLKKDE